MYVPEIRFCDSNDLSAILDLNAESPWPWPEAVIKNDFSPDADGELTYIGAFSHEAENLLGFAVLGRESSSVTASPALRTFNNGSNILALNNKTGNLMLLIVDRKYRRRGIASQLIMAVGDCAVYLGFKTLTLRVRRSNIPAQNLYKKFNFYSSTGLRADKNNAVIRGYYSDGEDALVMTARLPLKI